MENKDKKRKFIWFRIRLILKYSFYFLYTCCVVTTILLFIYSSKIEQPTKTYKDLSFIFFASSMTLLSLTLSLFPTSMKDKKVFGANWYDIHYVKRCYSRVLEVFFIIIMFIFQVLALLSSYWLISIIISIIIFAWSFFTIVLQISILQTINIKSKNKILKYFINLRLILEELTKKETPVFYKDKIEIVQRIVDSLIKNDEIPINLKIIESLFSKKYKTPYYLEKIRLWYFQNKYQKLKILNSTKRKEINTSYKNTISTKELTEIIDSIKYLLFQKNECINLYNCNNLLENCILKCMDSLCSASLLDDVKYQAKLHDFIDDILAELDVPDTLNCHTKISTNTKYNTKLFNFLLYNLLYSISNSLSFAEIMKIVLSDYVVPSNEISKTKYGSTFIFLLISYLIYVISGQTKHSKIVCKNAIEFIHKKSTSMDPYQFYSIDVFVCFWSPIGTEFVDFELIEQILRDSILRMENHPKCQISIYNVCFDLSFVIKIYLNILLFDVRPIELKMNTKNWNKNIKDKMNLEINALIQNKEKINYCLSKFGTEPSRNKFLEMNSFIANQLKDMLKKLNI